MTVPLCTICYAALPSSSQRRSLNPETSAANEISWLQLSPWSLFVSRLVITQFLESLQHRYIKFSLFHWNSKHRDRIVFLMAAIVLLTLCSPGDVTTFNYTLSDFIPQLTIQMRKVLLTRISNQGTRHSFVWRVWVSGQETTRAHALHTNMICEWLDKTIDFSTL